MACGRLGQLPTRPEVENLNNLLQSWDGGRPLFKKLKSPFLRSVQAIVTKFGITAPNQLWTPPALENLSFQIQDGGCRYKKTKTATSLQWFELTQQNLVSWRPCRRWIQSGLEKFEFLKTRDGRWPYSIKNSSGDEIANVNLFTTTSYMQKRAPTPIEPNS